MIIYNYIKGLNKECNSYSWLTWGEGTKYPSLKVTNTNDYNDSQAKFLGDLLTTEGEDQSINKKITLKNSLIFSLEDDNNNDIEIKKGEGKILNINSWLVKEGSIEKGNDIKIAETSNLPTINSTTINNKGTINTETIKSKTGTFSGQVDALSFNATSDERSKKEIKIADFNAIEMIKNWKVYTFKYKNANKETYIGTMAQDMLQNIGDFSFVNNKEASGYSGDYMTIKESKIQYVLLKAIQEQQEIIDNLRKEIKELKEKIK